MHPQCLPLSAEDMPTVGSLHELPALQPDPHTIKVDVPVKLPIPSAPDVIGRGHSIP